MGHYSGNIGRPDRARAIAGVIAVHAAIAAIILSGLNVSTTIRRAAETLTTIDVAEPPSPPERPPPAPKPDRAKLAEGAAGKKADPTEIVAPPSPMPIASPVVAAPVAGTGAAPRSGAALSGSGTGAGGSGIGPGGGSGGIGVEARLLGGNRSRLPSRLLRQFAADRGYAHLWLTVAGSGRVTDCSVLQGSGNAEVDQALCELMVRQSRWTAARDRQGRPITVKVRYTATWSKY